ncbi:hypothetical protein J6590_082293 [Homalodisca vitripennis]|nr:hypothetical protein J6590_082293 [Homalodisca vitripennis]
MYNQIKCVIVYVGMFQPYSGRMTLEQQPFRLQIQEVRCLSKVLKEDSLRTSIERLVVMWSPVSKSFRMEFDITNSRERFVLEMLASFAVFCEPIIRWLEREKMNEEVLFEVLETPENEILYVAGTVVEANMLLLRRVQQVDVTRENSRVLVERCNHRSSDTMTASV